MSKGSGGVKRVWGTLVMNKQRLISFVAVLCLAQLAIITSRQLQEKDSDLQKLRAHIQAGATWITDLLSGDDSPPQNQPEKKDPKTTPARSGELTPTLLNDDSPKDGRPPETARVAATGRSEALSTNAPVTRDPFVPFFSIRSGTRKDNPNPLTDYDLAELRVAAIIGDSAGNRSASIETSDGKSFIVKVGTKIGSNGGRIESITATTIVISEPADSGVGNQSAITKELSLKSYPTPPSGIAN